MNALIVEDEVLAANRLKRMLGEEKVDVIATKDTVRNTVSWLEENQSSIDLALFDIQLADGLSFEVFEKMNVKCPVIFTTAYDQYAIKAFEVNGIDYLLKPVKKEDLVRAISKVKPQAPTLSPELINSLINTQKDYKKQFVVKVGEHIKMIKTSEISAFTSEDKANYLIKEDGSRVLIDQTLDKVESLIDPKEYYRINRKFIIKMDAIQDIIAFSGSRLKLTLTNFESQDLLVARERVKDFKSWLET
ncbi:LytR/AlgR family response regulator transcription factor [Reichenbachiella versicolor]|uniref:LytR/AlgR family response regulator transcription factor n=1 Tax=Reichenbachiella versicolor TaxID=1821036 RepID=UPI000D6DD119|nr:LytTR family DNA-binding domain-containing protein [Reichenbachiella versicolor]